MGDQNSLRTKLVLQRSLALTCAMRRDIAMHDSVSQVCAARDIKTITSRCATEGLTFLTETLPRLSKALDKALAKDVRLDACGFKTRHGIPCFAGVFFERIIDCNGMVRSDACPYSIRALRQLLCLQYKTQHPYSNAKSKEVIDRFCATERELSSAQLPVRSPILRRARTLVTRIFERSDRDCAWDNIVPRHGPGSVATRERGENKYLFPRLIEQLETKYPFWEYFVSGLNHVAADCDRWSGLTSVPTPTAKVVLVPKDSRGPRLISCEPVETMWLQQGIMDKIVDAVERHPTTCGKVNFTDQTINQRLALKSSATQEYVTLDMKDASDRVSLDLVKTLFCGTALLEALLATRSTQTVLPDGSVQPLAKFAPMGSACCFPVEALCFWAIAVATIQLNRGLHFRVIPEVYVYGDDVICKRADYQLVYNSMEQFHLKWNEAKCCTDGFFRESCGVDAFKGVVVSPIYYRRPITSRRDASQYKSQLSLTNRLEIAGYPETARILRDELVAKFGAIPATSQEDVVNLLFFHTPSEVYLWNSNYGFARYSPRRGVAGGLQKFGYRTLVPVPRLRRSRITGWAAGLAALASNKPRQSDHVPHYPARMRLMWKFVEA